MLKVGATAFSRAVHTLGVVRGATIVQITVGGEKARELPVEKTQRTSAITNLEALMEQAKAKILGAGVTVAGIERLIRKLKDDDDLSLDDFSILAEQIESRLYDELEMRHVFVLDAEHAAYFEGAALSPQVTAQFPSAAYDLDEAGKCLSLARSTAAVFHLMRAMEVVLRAVRACIGIQIPLEGTERNWGTILRRISETLDHRKGFAENDLFREMCALLHSVKDAWRNNTMHVENKYTEEEAEHVYRTVRGFMKKVAARMDERGLPLA
jgi:HEPN domain-containing protein